MTTTTRPDVVGDIERDLRQQADRITGPEPDECLYCFLCRMVSEFGCDCTLRFTERWIAKQPRRHNWVIKWVQSLGGYCDCEVLMNTFRDERRSERHRKLRCAPSYGVSGF